MDPFETTLHRQRGEKYDFITKAGIEMKKKKYKLPVTKVKVMVVTLRMVAHVHAPVHLHVFHVTQDRQNMLGQQIYYCTYHHS